MVGCLPGVRGEVGRLDPPRRTTIEALQDLVFSGTRLVAGAAGDKPRPRHQEGEEHRGSGQRTDPGRTTEATPPEGAAEQGGDHESDNYPSRDGPAVQL